MPLAITAKKKEFITVQHKDSEAVLRIYYKKSTTGSIIAVFDGDEYLITRSKKGTKNEKMYWLSEE